MPSPADPSGLDGARLLQRLDELAEIGRIPGRPGTTRLAWSVEDRAARDLLAGWVTAPGITVAVDAVGTLTVEWPGQVDDLPPLVVGSHLDTVIDAGPLDGAYGTVAAFEIVNELAGVGERMRHPVRAVAWANEEGVVAAPFTGSRVAAGVAVDLETPGPDGCTVAERLRDAGGNTAGIAAAAWAPVAAYLELHIEQGPVLHDCGDPIGIVTAITGSRRGTVTVTGRANHAGTTPMHLRRDALVAAAPLVAIVEELATKGPADVATVGSLVVDPGSGNVVPGRVTLTYDIRSVDDGNADQALLLLHQAAARIEASTANPVTVVPTSSTAAVATDGRLRAAIADAARALGLASRELPSGAGHDAQHLAALGPMGMIFVPSTDGLSHHPDEATPPERLVDGACVLLAALRLADARLDP